MSVFFNEMVDSVSGSCLIYLGYLGLAGVGSYIATSF